MPLLNIDPPEPSRPGRCSEKDGCGVEVERMEIFDVHREGCRKLIEVQDREAPVKVSPSGQAPASDCRCSLTLPAVREILKTSLFT